MNNATTTATDNLNVATPNAVQAEGVKKPSTDAASPATPPAETPAVNYVGTRNAFNSMGFDDKDIGFDNGKVTIKGQAAVDPSYVQDGTAYAPEHINYAGAVDYLKNNGYVATRDGLNNRGIADERIGFNSATGNITIDGQDVFKPQYNVDGTTYITESDLNNIHRSAAEWGGDPLVAARDYTMASVPGAGNIVDWDGENVLIAGQAIKPALVQDGVAYVHESQLEPLIVNYKNANGLYTNNSIVENNNSKYGDLEETALNEIVNKEDFDYDLASDAMWKDHEATMMNLADEAYRRVLNDNGTSVTGASGAVLAEANAAKNDYLTTLADDAISFRDDAYQRYLDDGNWDRNVFADVYYASNDDYNKYYQANRDNYNDSYNNNVVNNQEKWNWRNYGLAEREANRLDRAAIFNNDYTASNTAINYSNHAMSLANYLGYFTPEMEKYIPGLWRYSNGDGTYSITPFDSEMQYVHDYGYNSTAGQLKAQKEFGY